MSPSVSNPRYNISLSSKNLSFSHVHRMVIYKDVWPLLYFNWKKGSECRNIGWPVCFDGTGEICCYSIALHYIRASKGPFAIIQSNVHFWCCRLKMACGFVQIRLQNNLCKVWKTPVAPHWWISQPTLKSNCFCVESY